MDTKFRSSFIPKSSSLSSFEKGGDEGRGFGIFGALAVLVFIASVVVTGGAFFYKLSLKSEVGNLKSQVSSALAAIDRGAVDEIVSFDKRLSSVREILSRHVAVSKYFAMLEKETVSQVQFTNLRYAAPAGGGLSINMNGKAKSYAAIALQEEKFLQDPNTLSVDFSGMKVDEKTGIVSFSLKGEFKNDLVKYAGEDIDLNLDDMENLDLDNPNI